MNIRITQITLTGNLPQFFAGSRDRQQISTEAPPPQLEDWTAHGRGRTLWLVSPPGWTEKTSNAHQRDKGGPRTIYRIPMGQVVLRFAGDDVENLLAAEVLDFNTQPFGPRAAEPPPPQERSAPQPAEASKAAAK